MTTHLIEGIDILLWSHPTGMSAFAAPWTFDLEVDAKGNATIDANRGPLSVGDYPRSVDRYRVLNGPERAAILKAALLRCDDYRGLLPGSWQHYLVRQDESGIDEAAFLGIVAAFIEAWRRH